MTGTNSYRKHDKHDKPDNHDKLDKNHNCDKHEKRDKHGFYKNIILTGMPGAGKSTVGPLLADKLGYTFRDTDIIIRENDGRELKNIVAEEGYEVFLEIQRKNILLQNFNKSVVATGGSVIMDSELMRYFYENGHIVYLEQDVDTLEKRLAPGRRLARAGGLTFRQMFLQREPLYLKYAETKVVCTDKCPEEIAAEIYKTLFKMENVQ
jgi:shikimate kinase